MSQAPTVRIAIDAMGGDRAPSIVVSGAQMAAERLKNAHFILCGDEKQLKPLLAKKPLLQSKATLVHAKDSIAASDKPSHALRHGKHSSMRYAIDAVKSNKADAVVSAGNTGALMAIARLVLRMLPTIERPAIVTSLPTIRGELVMLDLGANVQCDSQNLIQFAYMGDVYARCLWRTQNPSVGLLNVGSEDTKGHNELHNAATFLKHPKSGINFHGFIEGDDISKGTVDVVVCDGFSGNIALKTMEGTVITVKTFLERTLRSSLLSQFAALLLKPALSRVKALIDPRLYNGAMLVGLNGIVVKSHGGTDGVGFANALCVAHELVTHDYNRRVSDALSDHQKEIDVAARLDQAPPS
ncbi:MAG: phosphate acyltransferase PlsX [Alphaproteobacteria bacterium GM202ARS2]|nr:phosphate acyltransferase PlsX [Alphaproteobacteria bacterium GM202ARS2]